MHPFWSLPELQSRSLTEISWKSLANFALLSSHHRAIAQDEARNRVYSGVSPVSKAFNLSPSELFRLLDRGGGAVVGQCAERAYNARKKADSPPPKRLTVIFPHGKHLPFLNTLQDRGLPAPARVSVYKNQVADEATVSYVCEYTCKGKDNQVRPKARNFMLAITNRRQDVYLRVVESQTSVFLALASASSRTHDMVAISSTRMYAWFPVFLSRNTGWVRWHPVGRPSPSKQPKLSTEGMWGFDCGKDCLSRWRTGGRGDGIAEFWWNGEEERRRFAGKESLEIGDLFESAGTYRYRLAEECPNHIVFVDPIWGVDSDEDSDEDYNSF